jgi:AraC family transcriptional activator of tynA and feaB
MILALLMSRSSGLQVACTSRHAARSDPHQVLFFYSAAGQMLLEQSDRRVTVEQGGLAYVDPRVARSELHARCSRLYSPSTLVVKVPRAELKSRLGPNVDLAARRRTAPAHTRRVGS